MMIQQESILLMFEEWYNNQQHGNAAVPKGTIAGALVVLDRLKKAYDLGLDEQLTASGTQVKGASGENIKRILAQFGEIRHFVSEGGRTNRGLRSAVQSMLSTLRTMSLEELPEEERIALLNELQVFLVKKVNEFHSKERLKIVYDPAVSTWQLIYNILELARNDGKAGPVAQHLVGAKLKLRFPHEPIGRESYSTADKQLGRAGDFKVGDTAFHVTVAPMPGVYDKCERNIQDGFRAYLLVPYNQLAGAKQNIELRSIGRNKIAAESIESFVSQNIEELSNFSADKLADGLYHLLDEYNSRIEDAESDQSLLIDIPQNLLKRSSTGT